MLLREGATELCRRTERGANEYGKPVLFRKLNKDWSFGVPRSSVEGGNQVLGLAPR